MKLKNILTGTLLVAGLAGTFGCKYKQIEVSQIKGVVKGENFYHFGNYSQHKFSILFGGKTLSFSYFFTSAGSDAETIDALIDKGDTVRMINLYRNSPSYKEFKINKENIVEVNGHEINW